MRYLFTRYKYTATHSNQVSLPFNNSPEKNNRKCTPTTHPIALSTAGTIRRNVKKHTHTGLQTTWHPNHSRKSNAALQAHLKFTALSSIAMNCVGSGKFFRHGTFADGGKVLLFSVSCGGVENVR